MDATILHDHADAWQRASPTHPWKQRHEEATALPTSAAETAHLEALRRLRPAGEGAGRPAGALLPQVFRTPELGPAALITYTSTYTSTCTSTCASTYTSTCTSTCTPTYTCASSDDPQHGADLRIPGVAAGRLTVPDRRQSPRPGRPRGSAVPAHAPLLERRRGAWARLCFPEPSPQPKRIPGEGCDTGSGDGRRRHVGVVPTPPPASDDHARVGRQAEGGPSEVRLTESAASRQFSWQRAASRCRVNGCPNVQVHHRPEGRPHPPSGAKLGDADRGGVAKRASGL